MDFNEIVDRLLIYLFDMLFGLVRLFLIFKFEIFFSWGEVIFSNSFFRLFRFLLRLDLF